MVKTPMTPDRLTALRAALTRKLRIAARDASANAAWAAARRDEDADSAGQRAWQDVLLAALAPVLADEAGWQPIATAAERCMNGEPYLVYHADYGISVQWFAEKGTYRGFNWRADPGTPEPTHWTELTADPADAHAAPPIPTEAK